jgi:hypothetical protein
MFRRIFPAQISFTARLAVLALPLALALTLARPEPGRCANATSLRPGLVSLTFDNALAGVYENAFPLLKARGQVATVSVAPAKIEPGNDDFMTVDQLRELQDAGWEIASAGLHGKRATDIPMTLDREGSLSWRMDDPANHVFQATYEYANVACVLEAGLPLRPASSIEDMLAHPGSYYFDRTIEELHVRPRSESPDPAGLNLTVCSLEREMIESREILGGLGFTAQVFVTPHNTWSAELKALAGKHYPLAAAGPRKAMAPGAFDPLWISREFVREQDTAASVIRLLRTRALENREWVVLALRNIGQDVGREPWPQDKLRRVCDWLAASGVRTVTLSQGAALMANSLAIPAP